MVLGRDFSNSELYGVARSGLITDAKTQGTLSKISSHVRAGYLDEGIPFKRNGLEFAAFEPIYGNSMWEHVYDMRNKNITPLSRVVVRAMLGISKALNAGHAREQIIVHSDVKPQNVMVCSKARIYLIDYSQSLTDKGDEHTLSGSPAYMAPEILLGDGDAYDPKRDIYACGVMILELITQ